MTVRKIEEHLMGSARVNTEIKGQTAWGLHAISLVTRGRRGQRNKV